MPRVYLSEKERISARLARWIYGEMKIRRISQQSLAEKMGITQQTLSYKLREKKFSYTDFVFFVKEFEPTQTELLELIGV